MNTRIKPIVFLDLDGVCSDFVWQVLHYNSRGEEDFLKTMAENPEMHPYDALEKCVGYFKDDFWAWVDSKGSHFWSSMPEFSWFHKLYFSLKDISSKVYFLSSAPSTFAYHGKALWIQDHLGSQFVPDLIICTAKAKHLMAGFGRVLIDDTDKNIDDWNKTGNTCYHFPSLQFHKRHPVDADIEFIVEDIVRRFDYRYQDGIHLTE